MPNRVATTAQPLPIVNCEGALSSDPLAVHLHISSHHMRLRLADGRMVELGAVDSPNQFNRLRKLSEVNLYQKIDGVLVATHRLALRQIFEE